MTGPENKVDFHRPIVVYWTQQAWEGKPCIRKTTKKRPGEILRRVSEKVGCKPEQYLLRKLAGGMPEAELRRLYDMLAVEIAMKARCTAIRYDALQLEPAGETAAERHIRRAATHEVPVCARCGGRMVLRTGQTGARKGQKFWGCSNYPACRYTKDFESHA